MPCVRKIESLLRDQIYEKIKPGYSMSVSAAQNLVTNINKGYGYSHHYMTRVVQGLFAQLRKISFPILVF